MTSFPSLPVDKFFSACLSISENAADSTGFVSVNRLLKQFDANLVLRPLLVEAMLCEVEVRNENSQSVDEARWTLLIDSDRYPIDQDKILKEVSGLSLPVRFRNTVAHELAHTLAFREAEFGARLILDRKHSSRSKVAEVEKLERLTEALSPLLLVSERAIDLLFPASLTRLTVGDLVRIREVLGISRPVLISRLNMLQRHGSSRLRERACLFNTAIGTGRWTKDGVAMLSGWPTYINFYRGITPAFIHSARLRKNLFASEFVADPSFVWNGGDVTSVSMRVPAGLEKVPEIENLDITFSIEKCRKRRNQPFLFIATATSSPA